MHGNILKVLRSMYDNLKTCIRTPEGLTEFFECVMGTRQGCMLSPFLFSLYIGELIELLYNSGCTGIYIDEKAPNVMVLLFADDVAFCADSVYRLQAMIRILEEFCSKWGLRVNMEKTKVMVFRRGGKIKREENFYYKGKALEIVSYYKYLGIVFSPRLKWSLACKTLAQQASRAMLLMNVHLTRCKNLSPAVLFELFDKQIVPILLYGSEIWGTTECEVIEKVHKKFLKRVLGVGQNAPDAFIYGETGRCPLFVLYYVRCINYWIHILEMDDDRYPKRCYELLKRLDDMERHNWASEIRMLLCKFGFESVWLEQCVPHRSSFIANFREKLKEYYIERWQMQLKNSSKLAIYSTFKLNFGLESYLGGCLSRQLCITFARFRSSCLPLEIDNGRKSGLLVEERICKFCEAKNLSIMEDEYHFLLCCPTYNDIRYISLLQFAI